MTVKELLVGKTIKEVVDAGDGYFEVVFEDGTEFSISACLVGRSFGMHDAELEYSAYDKNDKMFF